MYRFITKVFRNQTNPLTLCSGTPRRVSARYNAINRKRWCRCDIGYTTPHNSALDTSYVRRTQIDGLHDLRNGSLLLLILNGILAVEGPCISYSILTLPGGHSEVCAFNMNFKIGMSIMVILFNLTYIASVSDRDSLWSVGECQSVSTDRGWGVSGHSFWPVLNVESCWLYVLEVTKSFATRSRTFHILC